MGGLNSRWIKNDFQFIKMGCICHVSLNRSKLGADYQEKFEILTLGGGGGGESSPLETKMNYGRLLTSCLMCRFNQTVY